MLHHEQIAVIYGHIMDLMKAVDSITYMAAGGVVRLQIKTLKQVQFLRVNRFS